MQASVIVFDMFKRRNASVELILGASCATAVVFLHVEAPERERRALFCGELCDCRRRF